MDCLNVKAILGLSGFWYHQSATRLGSDISAVQSHAAKPLSFHCFVVARAGVQPATFALGVRFLPCKDMLPIAARCGK
jgi:hypothetical protein